MRKKRLWIGILVFLFACFLLWGFRQYTTVRRLERVGVHAKSLAQDARKDGLDSRRAMALADDLSETESLLARLRRENAPFLFLASHMGWVPRVGGDLVAVPAFLDGAIDLSGAGAEAVRVVAPALDGDAPLASRLAGLGEDRLAALGKSADRVAKANRALSSVEGWRLSPRLGKAWRLSVEEWLPALEAGLRLVPSVPWLLGADSPRRYLVLLENNQELRPTGGFISGVGLVTVSGGKIVDMSFQDSYAVEDYRKPHPAPPEPLVKIMNFGVLTLRDSNWSPDFPTSARVAASLYRLNRGEDVDGVVALDLGGAGALADAVGPLRVKDYPEPVTGRNFMAVLEQFWNAPPSAGNAKYKSRKWWRHRKDFMGMLAGAAMARLQSGRIDPVRLAKAVKHALDERHILFCPMSDAAERPLARVHWDGALRQWPGDYIMVVDANLGYNKVNVNVSEDVEYRPGREATVVLSYRNRSPKKVERCVHQPRYGDSYSALQSGCYWDYVRLYVPKGSRLLSLEGSQFAPDVGEEAGKTFFGAYFVLPPGEEHRVIFHYAPPEDALGKPILFQKQPGTMGNRVRVVFSEPRTCRWGMSGWSRGDGFSIALTTDEELTCR